MLTGARWPGSLQRMVRRTAHRLWRLSEHLPNECQRYPAWWMWLLVARAKVMTSGVMSGVPVSEAWARSMRWYPVRRTRNVYRSIVIAGDAHAGGVATALGAAPPSAGAPGANVRRPFALANLVTQTLGRMKLGVSKCLFGLLQRHPRRLPLGAVGDKAEPGAGQIERGLGERDAAQKLFDGGIFHSVSPPNDQAERQPPQTTDNMNTQETIEEPKGGAAVRSSDLLAVIGEDGWESPSKPPDNDRLVQLAWDDMSYGESSRGFYDELAEIPVSGKRYWWSWPIGQGLHRIPSEHVGAWREMTANDPSSATRP